MHTPTKIVALTQFNQSFTLVLWKLFIYLLLFLCRMFSLIFYFQEHNKIDHKQEDLC